MVEDRNNKRFSVDCEELQVSPSAQLSLRHNTRVYFRLIAMESNMDRELERERSASQKHLNSNVDRELSQSASRMRIEGKSVPRGPARRGQK